MVPVLILIVLLTARISGKISFIGQLRWNDLLIGAKENDLKIKGSTHFQRTIFSAYSYIQYSRTIIWIELNLFSGLDTDIT